MHSRIFKIVDSNRFCLNTVVFHYYYLTTVFAAFLCPILLDTVRFYFKNIGVCLSQIFELIKKTKIGQKFTDKLKMDALSNMGNQIFDLRSGIHIAKLLPLTKN